MNTTELVFVYNADSNLYSVLTDFAHKILSPATYQCQLCALTYGNFTIKQDWKSFIEALAIKTMFLHKDEFLQRYTIDTTFPAVFLVSEGVISQVISPQSIENCQSLDELKQLILAVVAHVDVST